MTVGRDTSKKALSHEDTGKWRGPLRVWMWSNPNKDVCPDNQ